MKPAKNLGARIALAAFDATFATALAGTCWLALETPALAYVDPSVMTYTIQALAGVAVALSAVLDVVWRRARRVVMRILHIDENAGKVVEPAVRGVEADDAAAFEAIRSEARAERELQGKERPQRLPWGARFALALLVTVMFGFTTFVAAPLEIVATNASALLFSPTDVWQPLTLFAVCFAVAGALVLSALRGRVYDIVLALITAVGIAALLQALFFNTGLPAADGQPVNWDDFTKLTVASAAMWVVAIAAVVTIALKRPSAFKGFTVVACLLLALTSAISMGMTISAHASDFDRPFVTEEGLMDVSPKSNVIIFILDTFDTKYLETDLADDPHLLDEFDGFTYFRNSVGSMIPTRYGVPFLVTGHCLSPDEPEFTAQTVRSWFTQHNLLDDVQGQGYSIGVYSDPSSIGKGFEGQDKPLLNQTINVHDIRPQTTGTLKIAKTLGKSVLYRNLPWVLKPQFRFYTDALNQGVVAQDKAAPDQTPYVIDDPSYFAKLKSQTLKADDTAESGAYRIIHLSGAHGPYTMDEHGNPMPAGENSTLERQSIGSIEIVNEYLRQLKELGVYDQSTIIVTADHGEWYLADNLSSPTAPMLLVKPAGADASKPYETSEVPTGHLDIPSTVRAATGADPAGPTVFDVPDAPRKRIFFWTDSDSKGDYAERIWEVDGPELDFTSWHDTGRAVPIH